MFILPRYNDIFGYFTAISLYRESRYNDTSIQRSNSAAPSAYRYIGVPLYLCSVRMKNLLLNPHRHFFWLISFKNTVKFQKISHRGLCFSKALFGGLIFGGAYLQREICISKAIRQALQLEVNLPFLLCFTLYLRAIFQVQAPGGAYIWRGDLAEGPLHYRFGGLIHGGAYFWNFTILHSFLNPCQTSLLAKAVTCKLFRITMRKIISRTTLSDTGS